MEGESPRFLCVFPVRTVYNTQWVNLLGAFRKNENEGWMLAGSHDDAG